MDLKNTAKDPVCNMDVDTSHRQFVHSYEGQGYYFCSAHCLKKFQAEPIQYIHKEHDNKRSSSSEIEYVEYTCPMHPETIQKCPGSCPKCGMALEPKEVSLNEENHELKMMTKKFWVGLVITIPVFLSEMLPMVGVSISQISKVMPLNWFQLLLATPVVLWSGFPLLVRGWQSIVNMSLNMFTLIAIGTGAAYFYSVVATVLPEIFPQSLKSLDGSLAVYFEAASVITVLVLLGQALELKARSQTMGAIKELLNLAPKTASLLKLDGTEEEISLDLVKIGDKLRVKPGEKVPVDGIIVQGKSNVDESMITGEAIPTVKIQDSKVTGGTINGTGSFVMIAKKVGKETLLSQIIEMVGKARRSRAPIQRMADQVSKYFVPIVILISVLTFVLWSIFGPDPKIAYALVNAVAVLIIACPCALGLATPMSIMVGSGLGAKSGVLIKNAEVLETMDTVTTLIIDKTGTLTEGKPKVIAVETFAQKNKDEVLQIAASIEKESEHPLAEAIVREAQEEKINLLDITDFKSITGKGVTAKLNSTAFALGNDKLAEDLSADLSFSNKFVQKFCSEGLTAMYVIQDKLILGVIAVGDSIKETTIQAIKTLKREGISVIMATGDNQITAKALAQKIGLDTVYADVLPENKHRIVEELKAKGEIVAMAGDGVNDAPALAAANVGIAMGTGADIAIESAGVTLIQGDLLGIVKTKKLSNAVIRNIKQNLFFAFAYNMLGVPIAAGILFPFFGLLLSPMIAAAAMSFSSVSVISNSLRLKTFKF